MYCPGVWIIDRNFGPENQWSPSGFCWTKREAKAWARHLDIEFLGFCHRVREGKVGSTEKLWTFGALRDRPWGEDLRRVAPVVDHPHLRLVRLGPLAASLSVFRVTPFPLGPLGAPPS